MGCHAHLACHRLRTASAANAFVALCRAVSWVCCPNVNALCSTSKTGYLVVSTIWHEAPCLKLSFKGTHLSQNRDLLLCASVHVCHTPIEGHEYDKSSLTLICQGKQYPIGSPGEVMSREVPEER